MPLDFEGVIDSAIRCAIRGFKNDVQYPELGAGRFDGKASGGLELRQRCFRFGRN